MSDLHTNFIRQQGFDHPDANTCAIQYPALMFQPRVLAVLVLAGVALQAPRVFLTVSAVLWWNAFAPALNPFDKLYHRFMARGEADPAQTVAPPPRRFAQAMAATFMLVIAISLLSGLRVLAWIFEAMLLVALGALLFGGFCLGSFVFHFLVGNGAFARRTLPWSRRA